MQITKFLIEPGHRITLSCLYDEPASMHFIPVDCSSTVLTMVVMTPGDASVYQYDLNDERVRTFEFNDKEIGISFIVNCGEFLGLRFINCADFDISEEFIEF